MVWIDMIREWHGEANNYILACMDIRHDANLGIIKHCLVKEMIDHAECILFYIICENLAIFAILSF